jgi:hypothetical protein
MDTQKLDVSVILPIKTNKEKDFEFYFDKAITSLKTQKFGFNELIIVNANEEGLNNYFMILFILQHIINKNRLFK